MAARGADEHRLVVDAERGVLLRMERWIDGEPFLRVEVLAIAFDETFPDDTFVPEPAPVRARRPEETFPPQLAVSLVEATRIASFRVYRPARLPEGADYGQAGWEERTRDGWSLRVRDDGSGRQVVVDREGTRVHLRSGGLDLDTLMAIAAGLVPMSPEPPRLVDA